MKFKEGKRQPHSIELLPVVQERVHDSLKAAELTLLNVEAMKARPELNGKGSESMIGICEEQIDQLLRLREQCDHWHRTHLTPSQKQSIVELKKAISQLEKLSQQILFILCHSEDSSDPRSMSEALARSDALFETECTTMTAEHIETMKTIHDIVIQLAEQDVEGIEIFEATLDYLPMVDDIVSHHHRSVVMDYADHYPGFREYILLLEELSEKMAGARLKFRSDV